MTPGIPDERAIHAIARARVTRYLVPLAHALERGDHIHARILTDHITTALRDNARKGTAS